MINSQKEILYKKIFIYFSIVTITCLHFFTTIHIPLLHDIYQRLYYVPIICASIWFGIRYGLSTSVVISVVYPIHIIFQWKIHPSVSLEKYLEILLFNLVALFIGLLTDREKRLKNKYLETADKLKDSYEKLKKQTKEMIEIEEQLRRADRLTMLGQISAELAHEIRNPLGSIKGTVDIIKSDYTPENKKYEFIEIMIKETNRLSNVLNNFLNFTKEKGAAEEAVDVNELVKDVISFLNLKLCKNNINAIVNLDTSIPKIELEGEQLKQVFLNIIINAIQSMPGGGTLTVTTRTRRAKDDDPKSGDYLFIEFSDTGVGIDENAINNLFKPFYTSKDEGTGLGLSISQKIIEKLDGRILVTSKPGKGSTFTIKLPFTKRI